LPEATVSRSASPIWRTSSNAVESSFPLAHGNAEDSTDYAVTVMARAPPMVTRNAAAKRRATEVTPNAPAPRDLPARKRRSWEYPSRRCDEQSNDWHYGEGAKLALKSMPLATAVQVMFGQFQVHRGMCAPSRSWALSCSATFMQDPLKSPFYVDRRQLLQFSLRLRLPVLVFPARCPPAPRRAAN